jgi:hypothetical protein
VYFGSSKAITVLANKKQIPARIIEWARFTIFLPIQNLWYLLVSSLELPLEVLIYL